MACWNVHGLPSKLDDDHFINCLSEWDIAVLTETRYVSQDLCINGLKSYNVPHKINDTCVTCTGGVTLLCKNEHAHALVEVREIGPSILYVKLLG